MEAPVNTRTDIHRPGSDDFDPEAYDLVDVFDLFPENDMSGLLRQDRINTVNAMLARGYQFASHQHIGQCGHCGTRIRYAALMTYETSLEMIWVGETCLWGRFESTTKEQFQALRKAAALDRAKQARKAAFLELCDTHPVLVWATYARNIGSAGLGDHRADLPATERTWGEVHGKGWAIGVLDDIARKARQYGELSERQVEFITKLVGELETAEVETAQREAVAAAQPPAAPVPTGKLVVEGEILSTKWQDNDFGGGSLKMLVQHADGWKVWGTKPAALDAGVGDRVRFTATVNPSEDDQHFGFFKRPTKAEVLAPVGV